MILKSFKLLHWITLLVVFLSISIGFIITISSNISNIATPFLLPGVLTSLLFFGFGTSLYFIMQNYRDLYKKLERQDELIDSTATHFKNINIISISTLLILTVALLYFLITIVVRIQQGAPILG